MRGRLEGPPWEAEVSNPQLEWWPGRWIHLIDAMLADFKTLQEGGLGSE